MIRNKVTGMAVTAVMVANMFGGIVASAATTTIGTGDAVTKATTSQSVAVQFSQKDTIELTLSTNTVDFGDVTGIQTTSTNTTPTELVATVKSSLPYDLDVKATDNFTNKTDATAVQVPISKLGVKVDGGAISKFDGVNVSKNLISNAADTSAEATVSRSHTINFDLDQTVGYRAGSYEAPLTITATQK